jgi:hypothetical protein
MLPGLSQDDIYIMVEDEFHAVARTFTAHIHHAEYARLRDLARSSKASTPPAIARPVIGDATMREETQRKKEHEHKNARQQAALKKLESAITASDDGDLDPEHGGEPWAGTALSGLWSASPRPQPSRVGLHGVRSVTKAAAGFTPPKEKRPPRRLFDLNPPRAPEKKPPDPGAVDEATTEEEDDEDLDLSPVSRRAEKAAAASSFVSHAARPRRRYCGSRPTFDSDGFPQARPLRRHLLRKKDETAQKKEHGDGMNLNEIPIFLV